MQTVAASTRPSPSQLEQELAARGLAAHNQQYRSAPLDFSKWDQPLSNGTSSGGAGGVDGAAAASNDTEQAQEAEFERLVAAHGQVGADGIIDELVALGIGGAALYGAYRLWKSRRGGGNVDPRVATEGFVGDNPVQQSVDPRNAGAIGNVGTPIDAEFTEVPQQAIAGQRALPSPDLQLAGPVADNAQSAQPQTVREQLEASAGARRRMSREQAQGVADRAARGQPNDVPTIAAEEDLSGYSEEDIRRANALADELIAQRTRTGRGSTNAPVYAPRANEPVANQRPALVNEILRVMREAATQPGVARGLTRVRP